jgi:UTP--glucose-1-phosphate uridylyltransferase
MMAGRQTEEWAVSQASKIQFAVFPVAGRGTRFLPATKASPKEMLPIVDKPLIQYAAEEALSAGARKLVFITGSTKRAIADHFDADHELEEELELQGKHDLLAAVRGIVPSWASCIFIRQAAPLGLGHAVLCARPVVENQPFFVHLADDLIDAPVSCLKQMAQIFETRNTSVLGVETVPHEETNKYGIVATDDRDGRLSRIRKIVEKPKPENAPSNLAVVGRYLLTGTIFDKLQRIGRGAGGEIQLTDAIADLLADEAVLAYEFEGRRYDCGSKLGYLQATVEYALKHDTLGPQFSQYLTNLKLQQNKK